MTNLQATDLYHTGIIVKDVEASMRQLTDLFGYRWLHPVEYPVPVWTPEGESTVTLQMVYSIDEPRLELIREVPDSPWSFKGDTAIHHLGYFVDDVAAASKLLSDKGCPIEVSGNGDGVHPSGFAYHRCPGDLRVEVVPRGTIELMEAMTASLEAGEEPTT
jgi:Glyoxalase/Bleomycin resistance protein/Dioxygenase superfamily